MSDNTTPAVIDNTTGAVLSDHEKQSLVALSSVAAGLEQLKADHAQPVPDCTTADGLQAAKALRKSIASVRISVDRHHEIAKKPYLDGGRQIDAMKRQILQTTDPLEDRYKIPIKAAEDELKRKAAEAAAAEQQRLEAITGRIGDIHAMAHATTMEQIVGAIDDLNALDFDSFDELKDSTKQIADAMLATLITRRIELKRQAAEAEGLAEEKRQQEAEAEKLRVERAAIQKEKDDLAAEKQRMADEQKAADDAKLAAEKAEAERIQRDADEKARAEQAAAQAEKDKAAAVEKARQDERDKADAAKQRKADIEAERARIAAVAPDAVKLRLRFVMSATDFPTMETEDGKAALEAIADEYLLFVRSITPIVAALESSDQEHAA